MLKIISLGGGTINPNQINTQYIKKFRDLVFSWLIEDDTRRIILVTGGGRVAREYQEAYKKIIPDYNNFDLDSIGIMATKLNAEFIKRVMQPFSSDDIVVDPTADFEFNGRILVSSGWKPGFSTDYISVKFAERFEDRELINLTNVSQIYDKDPKKFNDAKPYDKLTWSALKVIVGKKWEPGSNLPFDPVATELASNLGLTLYFVNGLNIENLGKVFRKDADFLGTIVVK